MSRSRTQPHLSDSESYFYADGSPLPQGVRRINASNSQSFLVSQEDYIYFRYCPDGEGFNIISELQDTGVYYFYRCTYIPGEKGEVIRDRHWLHREVLARKLGHNDFVTADHIVHGPLNDHTRGNLRPATHSENCQNRKIGSNNTTGFTGVRQKIKNEKIIFEATIGGAGIVNNKSGQLYLGTYPTKEQAALARDKYIRKHNLDRYPLSFPEITDYAGITLPEERISVSHGKENYIPVPRNQRKLNKLNSTGFYGVCFESSNKGSKKYRVRFVPPDGKRISFGMFLTAEDAAKAYDDKIRAEKLDLPLNFPDRIETLSA